jgi:hypothetical protein
LSFHMNYIYLFFPLSIIFISNATRKRMWVIHLSISSPKSFVQEELMITRTTSTTRFSRIVFSFRSPIKRTQGLIQTLELDKKYGGVSFECSFKGHEERLMHCNFGFRI